MKDFIKHLKKELNLEAIGSCLFSSVGYSLGMIIPREHGLNYWICLLSCIIVGYLFKYVSDYFVKRKWFRDFKYPKFTFVVFMYGCYAIGWYIAYFAFHADISFDLLMNLFYLVLFAIIAYFVKFFKKGKKEESK